MKFQDYRLMFQVACLVFVLLAASPALSLVVSFPNSGEKFSELWLLGSNHMAEDYPFNIQVNDSYDIFLGVGNHMGISAYYLVCAKFRNQTQSLPNASNSEPSSLPSVYEFQFLVENGKVWETPVTFKILNASIQENAVVVENVSVNNQTREISSSSNWDSTNNGYYFQLFFELWLYNTAESSFQFHDRFVGIWLNMTS